VCLLVLELYLDIYHSGLYVLFKLNPTNFGAESLPHEGSDNTSNGDCYANPRDKVGCLKYHSQLSDGSNLFLSQVSTLIKPNRKKWALHSANVSFYEKYY